MLRNMFDRYETAYSEVDSVAGIIGWVIDDETRQKMMEIDIVKPSALTIATLVDERMSPNGQWCLVEQYSKSKAPPNNGMPSQNPRVSVGNADPETKSVDRGAD